MKIEEYKKFVVGKFKYRNNDVAMACAALGLIGEEDELIDAIIDGSAEEIINEAGDVMFKIVAVDYLFKINFDFKVQRIDQVAYCKNFADSAKKIIRCPDHKRLDDLKDDIKFALASKLSILSTNLSAINVTINDALDANVEKLTKRESEGTLINR